MKKMIVTLVTLIGTIGFAVQSFAHCGTCGGTGVTEFPWWMCQPLIVQLFLRFVLFGWIWM